MSNICDDLRAAILQAAMQGKLTKQLSEDGDAEELLKKIYDSKSDNKKVKKLGAITDEDTPFEIPENWRWIRTGFVCDIISGTSYSSKDITSDGIRIYRGGNVIDGGLLVDLEDDVRIKKHLADEEKRVKQGDVVIVASTGSQKVIGKPCLVKNNNDGYIGAFLRILRATDLIMPEYFWCYIRSDLYRDAIRARAVGTNINNVKTEYITENVFPLPPLAEQKRIVEKVDELMARVADLEQSADALASLKKAFPDDIKASLLQYAMQGKLTKQLPEDGNAEDLLEKIKAEKEKLIAEGKIKKQKPLAPITDDEIPFNIPENWKWARIGDVTYNHGQKTPEKRFSYIDVGTLNNVDHKLNDEEQIIEPEKASSRARKIVHKGDVIYATIRPYLHNICIIDRDFSEEPIASTAFAIMSSYSGIYNKYLFEALLSPDFDSYANRSDLSKGVAYPAIGEKDFFNGIIPLPPLAEQKRIVERLENLMQNINAVGELIASE